METSTRKERILHEALRQFSVRGFMATSITTVMEGAAVSKGGLYNHFKSKDALFLAALDLARKIWRDRNLDGMDRCHRPVEKVIRLLENYRDRYLADSASFPGGCLFVSLSSELNDQRPDLAAQVNEGFFRLKAMIRSHLASEPVLRPGFSAESATDLVFAALLGACVLFNANKSFPELDATIRSQVTFLAWLCSA